MVNLDTTSQQNMSLTDFPGLDCGPFEALDVQADGSESGEEDDSFNSVFLPLVMLRLCRPRKESSNILCHLTRRSGSS